MVVYVGIALVAVIALPVADGAGAGSAASASRRRCSASPRAFDPAGWDTTLRYVVAAAAAATLIAGGELGDARPLAAGLLAGHQPPDPQRASGACTRRARRRSS